MNELEFLHSIKKRLLDACIDGAKVGNVNGKQINILEIRSDAWHRIFKTDEYNELKEKK